MVKFPKGNNAIKDVCGVMVFVLCTSSDDTLASFKKISQRVSELLSGHDFNGKIFKLVIP